MRTTTYLLLAAIGISGCTKNSGPDPEYRLTAAQLAWQPYQVGQTMRFGTGNSTAVRTYNISKVNDRLEKYSPGGGGIYLYPVSSYNVQEIDVLVARTDSVSAYGATQLLYMGAASPAGGTSAYVGWGTGFAHELPLDALLGFLPFSDTTATLLPQLQLGSQTYRRVARLSRYNGAPTNSRTVQRVFYAEQVGVVGFVEGRTLWYRLP